MPETVGSSLRGTWLPTPPEVPRGDVRRASDFPKCWVLGGALSFALRKR